MWKAEKGFALKYTSVLGTGFPLVGEGKERRHPHIPPFSGLLFEMPYQPWGPAQALDPTFLSGSYWYYPQLSVLSCLFRRYVDHFCQS